GATNLGTGPVVVSNNCYISFFGGGTFYNDLTLNGFGGNVEGQPRNALFTPSTTVLNGKMTLNALSDVGTGGGTLTLNGVIDGSGGLLVASANAGAPVVLTAANTFSGGTTVTNGLLKAQAAGSLGTGNVIVQNSAMLELDDAATINSVASLYLVGLAPSVTLNFSGTQTIKQLYLNGGYVAAGTWGAIGSGAANESSFFTGSGLLNVTSSGTLGAGSGAWMVDAGGTWDNPLNWRSNTIPAGVGNTAYFTNHLTSARTVTVDTAKTIGKLVFGQAGNYGSNNWNVGGSQILTLDNDANAPEIICWPLKDYNSACTLSCPISSSLGLLKTGTGSLWLSGNNLGMNGTLIVAQGRVFNNVASGYGIGNMNVVVSNGCYLSFWKGGDLPNSFTLTGMGAAVEGQTQSALMASSGTSASDFTVEGTVTLNATSDIGGSYSNQLITLNGLVTGPGGLVKNGLVAGQPSYLGFTNGVGPGMLVLAHAGNDYAGGTWVNGGLLQAQAVGSLGAGDVTVADGAQLELDDAAAMDSSASLHLEGATSSANLNFSGTQTIHTLFVNGSPCAAGTWGATGSGAANENAALTGSGLLSVSVTGTPVTSGTPTNITFQVSAGNLALSWPADHLGWYAQSNSVSLANPGAWFDVPGSQTVTNLNLPVNPSLPQVYYRLRHP
ncbi:MAG: autotransporter-associated beta strand repeat-containing protein, partial [Verrucomicrobiota bacterium]